MLKATIIYEQRGLACYNCLGEQFFIDEFYELKIPFYTCYVPLENSNEIVGAFQEKKDLLDWMAKPLLLNNTKEIAV